MSEKILDRIAKLLEQGNHPGTGQAEREADLSGGKGHIQNRKVISQ